MAGHNNMSAEHNSYRVIVSEAIQVNKQNGQEYLGAELGKGADVATVNEIVTWLLAENPLCEPVEKPKLVSFSGHPGAGKSTLSAFVRDALPFMSIHSDRIRHEVNQRGIDHMGAKSPYVSAVRNSLIAEYAKHNLNMVIDQFINPTRAYIMRKIVKSINPDYEVINFFLNSDEAALIGRLEQRQAIAGFHTGTADHLRQYKNQVWTPNPDMYDYVINTSSTDLSVTQEMVYEILSSR